MAENVFLCPSGQIEPGADRKKIKAGLRHFGAMLTRQSLDQNGVHGVEEAHIGSGIFALSFGEFNTAPVARLLLLGDLLAEQFAHQILQTVTVGIGAGHLAGDLGAEHRRGGNTEVVLDSGQIEAGEMIELQPRRIGQHRLQVRGGKAAARAEADKVFVAPAIGNLEETKPVTRGDEPHRFGIDSDRTGGKYALGEIFFVEIDSHMGKVLRLISVWMKARTAIMANSDTLPESWRPALEPVLATAEARRLGGFLKAEEAAGKRIYPPRGTRLAALDLTPLDQVKVVILGQDPYHGPGQAHGLCFSVQPGVKVPPSLVNIYKELEADLGLPRASHGNLESWARQGVLLLNNSLTVEDGKAGSHAKLGWEPITDAAVAAVAAKAEPCVFLLWGSHAKNKAMRVAGLGPDSHHLILTAPHPSPLSAHSGFLGCRHFSQANAFLEAKGRGAIDWRV